jgi:hypothetical protein
VANNLRYAIGSDPGGGDFAFGMDALAVARVRHEA